MTNLCVKLFYLLCQFEVILVSSLSECPPYTKLNSYPGNGWCSLRNIEMNPVFSITYNKCQVLETPNGNFLIPDHFSVTPKSASDIDTSQVLIRNHQDFTSTTARSMSASASGGFGKFSAAGSFSNDYQNLKRNQVINDAATLRITARYVLHAARVDEYAVELHPDLKGRLMDAIEAITNGQLMKASLILELTILSHGTHVVTAVDLGGVIVKEDPEWKKKSYLSEHDEDQHIWSVSASIGYADFFQAKASFSKSDYASQYNEYAKNIKTTKIISHGGELLNSPTLNISKWVESLPNYLVSGDHSGVALPYVITPRHFPSVNQTILAALRREYVEAIEHFNAVNIHVGCMNRNASNFDYNANIGDESCDNPPTKYNFGGVFQTCYCINFIECSECNGNVVKNLLTNDYKCPDKFKKVYLNGKSFRKCWDSCYTTWVFFFRSTKCKKECIDYEYKAYWCASDSNNIAGGLMFGGVFTSTSKNLKTDSKSCPPTYSNVTILQDLTVCMSYDYEFGYKYAVHFGGFFSCNEGNPLALLSSGNNTTLQNRAATPTCGDGYTQHTAAIDNDCLISYCTKANSFGSGHKEITIVLPPFQNYDEMFAEEALLNGELVLSGSSIAIIVLGSLLGLVISGIVSFIGCKKCKQSSNSYTRAGYESMPENEA